VADLMPPLDPGDPRPAIVVVGEVLARRALLGEPYALGMIAERSEGKVGLRPGGSADLAPEASRQSVQAVIEDIVEMMTQAKLGKP
jgi:hypothetical protein